MKSTIRRLLLTAVLATAVPVSALAAPAAPF